MVLRNDWNVSTTTASLHGVPESMWIFHYTQYSILFSRLQESRITSFEDDSCLLRNENLEINIDETLINANPYQRDSPG